MKLDSNNNGGMIYRIARSNLAGKRMYTCFSLLTVTLATTFITTMALFLQGAQTVEKRMLDHMQQVMFMNVSEEQMEAIAADERTEMMVPYKESGTEFKTNGVKYSFNYMKSQRDKIQTYVPAEGKEPEKYEEIVVDKRFMDSIGQECAVGGKILLDVKGTQQEFEICGYTDRQYDMSVYSVYVSREFADQSPLMKEMGYTALVRIADAQDMESSVFETTVYQMAADYGIRRYDVNINGRFEESLQAGNTALYAILLISLFILAASAIVIYSIFYLSVASRTQQIGQLQTIGMTQKQIKKMVHREGVLLCSVSVPAALVLGGVIAYFLQPEGWSFSNYAVTAALAGIFSVLAVQVSVGKPAALAAQVSPIEAARNSGCAGSTKEDDQPHKRLTAFVMAQMGQKRNRKKQRLMTASIAFGGIIFMIASSYLYAWDETAFSREGEFADAEYIVSYLYNAHVPSTYGPTEMQLTGHLNEGLKKELSGIPHIQSIKPENTAFGNMEYQGATWGQGFYRLTKESDEYFHMEAEGNSSYEYLCEHDGLLITNSEFLAGINGVSFQAGDKITLRWFDGEEHSAQLEIAAVTQDVEPANHGYNICMADKTMEKLWGNMNTISSFYISVEDYEQYGDQTEQEIRAVIEPYSDLSLETLREKMLDDLSNIHKIRVQIYGISAFVILFSLLNLIHMLAGNVVTRKRELSMLESIGMEEKQIRKMLFWESLMLVFPAILITFAAGGAAGYGAVLFLQKIASYMNYRFPMVPVVLYAACMVLIPLVISYVGLKEQNRTSLVDRIRNED